MSSFLSTLLWKVVILVLMSARTTTLAQDCSGFQEQVEFGPGITLDYTVVQDEGGAVLRGRMTYQHSTPGYVAIGFPPPGGGMVGATAIIGLLDQAVQMWDLGSYSLDDVVPSPDGSLQGLLQQGSFAQTDEESVLDFEVALDESLNLVADGSTESSLIWAVGGGNALAYHASRGSSTVTLDVCTTGPEEGEDGGEGGTDDEEDGGGEADGEEEDETPSAGDCSGFQDQVEFVSGVTLDYTVVEEDAQVVMKGKVTYQHPDSAGGYVAIGFSEQGGMLGSKAIIGLLDEELQMWDLTSYAVPGVTPSDSSVQDLLVDGSFVQSADESVLEFVVVVDQTELNLVADGAAESQLIWAVGGSNMLTVHTSRGNSAITLDVCVESGEDTQPPTTAPTLSEVMETDTEPPTTAPTLSEVMETDTASPTATANTAAPTAATTTAAPTAATAANSTGVPATTAPTTAASVPDEPSGMVPATDAPMADPLMMSPTLSPVAQPTAMTAAPTTIAPTTAAPVVDETNDEPTKSPEASSSGGNAMIGISFPSVLGWRVGSLVLGMVSFLL